MPFSIPPPLHSDTHKQTKHTHSQRERKRERERDTHTVEHQRRLLAEEIPCGGLQRIHKVRRVARLSQFTGERSAAHTHHSSPEHRTAQRSTAARDAQPQIERQRARGREGERERERDRER